MARALTARQQEVYQFIRARIEQRGYGPTVREIGEFLEIKSPNGVMCHLKALQRKGMISRTANKSRSIELTDRATLEPPACLPVHGKVTSRACNMFTAPESLDVIGMLQRPECYLLQYSGDDLRDYAIADGDILIIEHATSSPPGSLALVRRGNGSIELATADPISDNKPHLLQSRSAFARRSPGDGAEVDNDPSASLHHTQSISRSPAAAGEAPGLDENRVVGLVVGIFRAHQPTVIERRPHLAQRSVV